MDIKEVKNLKKDLENKIADLLNEFTDETGVGIMDISINRYYIESESNPINYKISLDIKL